MKKINLFILLFISLFCINMIVSCDDDFIDNKKVAENMEDVAEDPHVLNKKAYSVYLGIDRYGETIMCVLKFIGKDSVEMYKYYDGYHDMHEIASTVPGHYEIRDEKIYFDIKNIYCNPWHYYPLYATLKDGILYTTFRLHNSSSEKIKDAQMTLDTRF